MRRAVHLHQGCGCGCGGHGGAPRLEPSRDWAEACDDEVVCSCGRVTKRAVVEAIEMGAYTLPLLKAMTGAGRGRDCERGGPDGRGCEGDLASLLELYGRPSPLGPAPR